MMWHLCTMDDGVIYTDLTKFGCLAEAERSMVERPVVKKIRAGLYEVTSGRHQVWIVREDQLEHEGWSAG